MDAATPSRVAGLDWASRRHAVCVLDPDGQVRARFARELGIYDSTLGTGSARTASTAASARD
jgi:hypothetical protein